MKYGDTLQQRSIPEWRIYNVDYNEIKHLIKIRTSKSPGRAIAIPGRGDESEAPAAFEKELYQELLDQHQRIDLFVKSKSGEIGRRLDHLRRQIAQLELQCRYANPKRISVRRVEKFSRVESEVLKAGEEIQSLARFVGVQRLAFAKLLKKYQKWTGSSNLGVRFQNDVLGKPQSFSQKDFGSLLWQWTDVLAAVRAPFEADFAWKPSINDEADLQTGAKLNMSNGTQQARQGSTEDAECVLTSGAQLVNIFANGSDVDVDTALATLPLGNMAGRAVYWVHSDNLVQLHVLLLQHTRIRKGNAESVSSRKVSLSRSRNKSLYGAVNGGGTGADDQIGSIICDNLQEFVQRYNGTAVGELETLSGSIAEAAAASIRYSVAGDTTVAITSPSDSDNPYQRIPIVAKQTKLKRKLLHQLFSSDEVTILRSASLNELKGSNDARAAANAANDPEFFRRWFKDHRQMQPLVHCQCRRTRFTGLANTGNCAIWAALDKDVSMKKSSLADLASLEYVTTDPTAQFFPHAVLEVRWEGGSRLDLVRALDESHLTERVRGFSLEAHAIAVLFKPPRMPDPIWFPLLEKDIRKVPAPIDLLRRQSTTLRSPTSPNTGPSTSTASGTEGQDSSSFSAIRPESPSTSIPDQLEAPPLKSFKKKRRVRKEHPLRKQVDKPHVQSERYWNEFDDGEEAPSSGTYTILINPSASGSIPGYEALSEVLSTLTTYVQASSKKIRLWLHKPGGSLIRAEHRSLLDETASYPRGISAETSDVDSDTESLANRTSRRYSTFTNYQSYTKRRAGVIASRSILLLVVSVISFLASVSMLLAAFLLDFTRRKRYSTTADVGSWVGIATSAVLAGIGVGAMMRMRNVVWMSKVGVGLLMAVIGLGNVVLVVILVSG